MASKTSFFNKTVFKKDLTRFAPAAVLYTIALVVMMTSTMEYFRGGDLPGYFAVQRFGNQFSLVVCLNLLYAPALAALLFGDLLRGRMAPALHALPMRRESWFVCHCLAGLVFSLAPTALAALLSLPTLQGQVENAWVLSPLWFLTANLSFVTFFGIAVFAVFCAGNLAGAAAVYAGVNFWSAGAVLAMGELYEPLLYGVILPQRLLEALCPVAAVGGVRNIFALPDVYTLLYQFDGDYTAITTTLTIRPEALVPVALWALAGLAFLAAGLLLYRRRDLERAGDPMAFPKLDGVFQLLTTAAGGCAALVLKDSFNLFYDQTAMVWALEVCGLAVGWFAGKMLLERGTQVFRPRNWRGLVLVLAVLAGTFFAARTDVLGLETRMPEAADVQSVKLSHVGSVTLTEPEEIQDMLRLHEIALQERVLTSGHIPASYVQQARENGTPITMDDVFYGEGGYSGDEEHLYAVDIYLTYELKNGSQMRRRYNVLADGEAGEILRTYLSRWEAVYGYYSQNQDFTLEQADHIDLESSLARGQTLDMAPQKTAALLEALQADCAAGTMAQETALHTGTFTAESGGVTTSTNVLELRFYATDDNGSNYTIAWISVFADSVHTIQWLNDQGLLEDITVYSDLDQAVG